MNTVPSSALRLLFGAVAAALITGCASSSLPSSPVSTNSAAGMKTAPAHAKHSHWSFKPMFKVTRHKGSHVKAPAGSGLPLWNGSFVGTIPYFPTETYNFTMVGTDPATSNATTTVPIEIIPVEIRIGNTTYSPLKRLPGDTKTVLARTLDSPLFQKSVDFVQGGTNVGKTQYIDAFQRANFWQNVQTNSSYHVLFKPTVAPTVKLKPVGASATIINGVGMVDYVYFDSTVQSLISSLKVPANTLPLFLASGVYWTEFTDECCIGGWHGSLSSNSAYAVGTYMPSTVNLPGGVSGFSQNVSALSHELGEFMDDPITNNVVCGGYGILEVGDPLEGGPNFGSYPYTTNGFTYDLQDLVTLPYFGAPPSTSVNGWSTFQGQTLSPCSFGG